MLRKVAGLLGMAAFIAGLVFLLAVPVRAEANADPFEPNNRRADATNIGYGFSINGLQINPAGDVDMFKFHGTAGDVVRISAWAGGADPTVELMKADGTVLIRIYDNEDDYQSVTLNYTLPAGATYYIRVLEDGHPNAGGAGYTYSLGLIKLDAPPPHIYVSTTAAGTVQGVAFDKRDILMWDYHNWSLFFDGSQKGLPGTADINAFDVANADTGSIVAAFLGNVSLPGAGTITPFDLALYNSNGWSMRFDGSDVGLSTSGEKIDAVDVQPADNNQPAGLTCLKNIWLSTVGAGQVTDYQGKALKFSGEDVLGFCVTRWGSRTEGKWYLALDGSAEGLPLNATNGLGAVDWGDPHLTTKGTFSINGVVAGPSMVDRFATTNANNGRLEGYFEGPYWQAIDAGLAVKTDGIDIINSMP